ncbi:ABC transporter ATP-binding protein [Luteococcus sp. OSA5]|uniref:ABC transporter ATP-binding protein n=1 Tax=Luteococcus sp. OSA5 TaxID=3401630 RepID=UPI003B42E486
MSTAQGLSAQGLTERGLTAQGWGWRHAGRSEWAVRDVSFHIEEGERVLLLGASGAGKSTLLHALAGVLGGDEEGTEQGRLLVDGRHPTRARGQVGLVLQDPDSQVVLAQVGDDVAFGLENLAVPREQIWPRVGAALEAVGLDVSLERPTSALSGGQKQRLAIAGVLAMQSRVLLMDEPTANLDPQGATEVRNVVARLTREQGTTLVVVEHRVDLWADLVDRVLVLGPDGGLLADGNPQRVFVEHRQALLDAGVWVPGEPLPPSLETAATAGSPDAGRSILHTEALDIGHSAQHVVQQGLEVAIPAGRSTMVTGANGAGKSTLAMTMAGLLPQLDGRVVAERQLWPSTQIVRGRWRRRSLDPADPGNWASRDLLTRIGTVFQEPEHQFVTSRVRDELAVGLHCLAERDGSWTPERIAHRVDELLALLHLNRVAQANPFTLSGGEKRRLSVGTVLATGPQVIFLDEPTFGQDRNTWLDMVQLVRSMLERERTVVSITHDADFIRTLGQHRVQLEVQHG